MNKLRISKSKLELLDIELKSPFILIGRSPLCDEILRAPGVQPVHFLLEWLGEGEFNPEKGLWSLLDVSQNKLIEENSVGNMATGQGVILAESTTNFADFTWTRFVDRMAEVNIEKGIIKKNLQNSFKSESEFESESISKNKFALELVKIDRGDQVVDNIYHHFLEKNVNEKVPDVPVFKIKWNMLSKELLVDVTRPSKGIMTVKGEKIDSHFFTMNSGEVYRIFFEKKEFILRLVQKIEIPKTPYEILSSHYLKFVIGFLFVFAISLYFVNQYTVISQVENTNETPRLVKIKEVEIEQVKEPAKIVEKEKVLEPEKIVKPDEPIEKKKEDISKLNKDEQSLIKPQKMAKESVSSAPTFKTQKSKPKIGLNSPAKVENINKVGLLGKLKKSNDTNYIQADKLTESFIDDTASSKNGIGVVVKTAQSGVVDLKSLNETKNVNDSQLLEATTTLQGADHYSAQNGGPIASNKGLKGKTTYGVGQGKDATFGEIGTQQKIGNNKENLSNQESVVGGLTKAQVKESIDQHRREIRTCYESALQIRNTLNGNLSLEWIISPDGNVSTIKIKSSETGSSMLDSCVMQVIKNIIFLKAPNGQSTKVIYPFIFKKS